MKYINFMPNKFRQLKQNKPTLILTLLVITIGVFFVMQGARADFFTTLFGPLTDPIGFLGKLLLGLFLIIIQFLGVIFVFFVGIMIELAKFNTFIDMPMVETGWGLARDVANMFFIVVLLIIAFSTVLKISSYHYQKTLTKLLIMAILVNFSKLIAGFLIDFFQVIMLTFVNGFKDVAGGNLAQGFGIYEMLSQAPGITDPSTLQSGFVVAGALAVVMILVADMVILIMIAVLMWRIAMLWVLVIISPLAYLSYAFMPKYWSQWWQMFFQHLISGPVIAFFLWLALLTMQQGEITKDFNKKSTGELQSEMARIIPSNVNQSVLLNYMVVMALLLGGLTISQKVAAQSGSAVGNFAQKVQKIGTRAAMIGTGAAAAGWLAKKGTEGVKKGVPLAYDLATRKLNIASKGRTAWITNPIKNFRTLRAQQGIEKEQEERLSRQMSSAQLQKGGFKGAIYGLASPDVASNMKGLLGYKYWTNAIGHKAVTSKQQFEAVENKIKDAETYSELASRPNRNEFYLKDKQQEAEIFSGDHDEAIDKYKNHQDKVNNLKKESKATERAINKESDEIEKEGKKQGKSDAEIKKDIDNNLTVRELRQQKSEIDAKVITLENSDDWIQEKKRLAVHAFGYNGAISEDAIKLGETVKDKDGKKIELAETIHSKNEKKQAELKKLERLDKDSKELPDLAQRKKSKDQLDKEADDYLNKKLKEKQEEKKLLQEGGLSKGERKTRQAEAKEVEKKIRLAQADLVNFKGDPVQTQKLNELITALEANKKALLAQATAKTTDEIKAVFKPEEIEKNKEDNKKNIELVDKEIRVMEDIQKNPNLSMADREAYTKKSEEIKKQAEVLKKKAEDYASYLPQAYYGRQQGRVAIAEEKKKIDTSNEDELIALVTSALRNKDQFKVMAVAARAAEVGHLNEIIQAIKASKNITRTTVDGKEELMVKAGEYMPSGVEGLHAFSSDVLQNQLGLNEQVALAFENDLSDIAQDVGHWTFAQAMGVQGGQFVQRGRDEQQVAVSIEKSKQDFENLMRRTNRLGWTTEKWADPKVGSSSGRISILNAEAIESIRSNFKAMDSSISKQRFNPNLALNLTTSYNMKILEEVGKSLPKIERKEWNHFMNSLLDYVNKTKDEAYASRSAGKEQEGKISKAKDILKISGINY